MGKRKRHIRKSWQAIRKWLQQQALRKFRALGASLSSVVLCGQRGILVFQVKRQERIVGAREARGEQLDFVESA